MNEPRIAVERENQAMTTSGGDSWSLLAHCQIPMPRGAMFDGGVHVQPLRGRMLACDHDIHTVAAAQAMIHDAEQAVRIGREIDAHDIGLHVDDMVEKARVLVGEAVVVLAPDVRGEQVVEGGDPGTPG